VVEDEIDGVGRTVGVVGGFVGAAAMQPAEMATMLPKAVVRIAVRLPSIAPS
jgi:hypothetical protein